MRNVSLAGNILLFIFGLLFIFHLLVLSGIIPYDIVWAGKISNREEMIRMESISLFLLAIAIMVVVLRMEYLPLNVPAKINRIGIGALVVLFTLNTIGNFTAKHPLEKYGFGLLTFVITLLLLQLAIVPQNYQSCKKY